MSSRKSSRGPKKATRAPPSRSSSKTKRDWKAQHKHLFPATKKTFKTGRDIPTHTRDLSRLVKWPRYVRLQRQRAILKKRIKVPPAINHFAKTLDKNQASQLFRLLAHYRPESGEEKKQRLVQQAAAESKGQGQDPSRKPRMVKFGINHVTQLVESRKAKLVVISHDVDPIDIVVWLPALCRRMDVPYCIIKGKSRLGHLVHQKTATAVAITEVRREHTAQLEQVINSVRPMYNDADPADRRRWGGGVMGYKAQAAARIQERIRAREAAAGR